ncbi:MAG: kinase/pyrophosphorylase [Anaerolineae bacterium]|nr:kinase/pyrophosphorylase [Anaerolineae bacterium]MCX8068721.1 kinase/pyrophosphorylase [Anaerolineae bacterium]
MKDVSGAFVVFAVSDGTGTTAERVLRAALTQFPQEVEVRRIGEVRTVERIREVVREAAQARALIVHTLVSAELRQAIFEEGRRHHVHTLDLMGPLLERLTDLLGIPPLAQPGLYRMEDFNRRIEAVDFALRHDDGQNVEELVHAEIVLVGVSRTGKTPLGIYLAYRGWLVGNVPIVLGVRPPSVLSRLPPERVIGLTVDPVRLAQLRQARARRISDLVSEYADLRSVRAEVVYALDLFHQHGWQVVDMTSKPVEEAAAEVVALVTGRPTEQGEG